MLPMQTEPHDPCIDRISCPVPDSTTQTDFKEDTPVFLTARASISAAAFASGAVGASFKAFKYVAKVDDGSMLATGDIGKRSSSCHCLRPGNTVDRPERDRED